MTRRDRDTDRSDSRPEERARDVEDLLARADEEKLRRLLDDIRSIPPWWDREPMGRA